MLAPGAAFRSKPGTFVFTDLVGFTEYTAVEGDEAALTLVLAHESKIRDAVGERGRVVKSLGDGLMLFFDDPCDAIEVSLGIQAEFEGGDDTADLPLWVRIGIHHGQSMVSRDDLLGHDVNLASRLVDLAGPGEVLVTEAAVNRVNGISGVEFEEMGPTLMKGIPDPVMVYHATQAHAQAVPA